MRSERSLDSTLLFRRQLEPPKQVESALEHEGLALIAFHIFLEMLALHSGLAIENTGWVPISILATGQARV